MNALYWPSLDLRVTTHWRILLVYSYLQLSHFCLVFRQRYWKTKKRNKSSKDHSLPWHAASFLNGVLRHKPTFTSLLSILLVIPTYLETTGSHGGGSPSMAKFSAMLTTMHIQIFMGTIILHSFMPRSQTICILTITKYIPCVAIHRTCPK